MEVDEGALNEIDAMYSSEEDKKKKKRGKNIKKEAKSEKSEEIQKDNGTEQLEDKEEQSTSTVLSSAQKKKLKKERNKANKAQIKKDEAAQDQSKTASNTTASKDDGASTSKGDEKKESPETDNLDESESADKKDDKKKNKKKKKGATAEEPKEKTKESARSKHIAKIKENLQKKKEEEDRLRREEEERIRREEEADRLKKEEERIEKERKERKKQKEKEKKLRLKAEGKLLTEKEKQNRRRVQELVAVRGIDLNSEANAEETEKKKKPRYEKLKKRNRPDKVAENTELETSKDVQTITETINNKEKLEDVPVVENDDDEEDDWEKLADDELEDNSVSAPSSKIENLEIIEGKDAEDGKESSEAETGSGNEEDESENEDADENESESDEDEDDDDDQDPLEKARERIRARHIEFEEKRSPDKLRAPVVCVLGHVDTGKTKILDKLRRTHVQDGEAGGITQQIGATNVPSTAILDATKMCKEFQKGGLRLPGLLIIDTPGHESFSNLRSRGSSLCDIAILVVDIMHGIEPQTIESIQLLKKRKTPFIVALNKIDRLFQWRTNPSNDITNTLKKQQTNTLQEFNERVQNVIAQFAVQELNACLFNDNSDLDEYISMVPTSAHTGDGMGNLLAYLCDFAQKRLTKRLAFSEELEATVMEVKEITGLGTTIDVILVNGRLHENSHIIIAGQDRPIVTQVRGLLMPQPMKELRVKNAYSNFKEVEGAQGVKIIAKDLEKALAGLPLFSSENQFEQEVYCEEVSRGLSNILRGIQVSEKGVYVQASTLGSLEALLEFLRTSKIPYASINIGPVHRRDVMKASVMLDRDPQWAVILAFDVKVEREAQEMAESLGVRIFTADIIYHLFDRFMQYRDELKRANQDKYKSLAVFPVKLRVLPQFIFNSRDPIVCGVAIEAGILREGTPIIVPSKNMVEIGRVTSIESNKKPLQEAKKGQEVCIKIAPYPGDTPKLYGRHFDHTDMLVSKITRESIDAVKDYFRDELAKEDWKLMVELKKVLGVS